MYSHNTHGEKVILFICLDIKNIIMQSNNPNWQSENHFFFKDTFRKNSRKATAKLWSGSSTLPGGTDWCHQAQSFASPFHDQCQASSALSPFTTSWKVVSTFICMCVRNNSHRPDCPSEKAVCHCFPHCFPHCDDSQVSVPEIPEYYSTPLKFKWGDFRCWFRSFPKMRKGIFTRLDNFEFF